MKLIHMFDTYLCIQYFIKYISAVGYLEVFIFNMPIQVCWQDVCLYAGCGVPGWNYCLLSADFQHCPWSIQRQICLQRQHDWCHHSTSYHWPKRWAFYPQTTVKITAQWCLSHYGKLASARSLQDDVSLLSYHCLIIARWYLMVN